VPAAVPMSISNPDKLAALIKKERDALLTHWRDQVRQLPSARNLNIPALNDHIPGLFDELISALQSKSDQTIPEALAEGSPPAHGLQRLQDAEAYTAALPIKLRS
jgi:two-component system, OmpR family, phosphate regulon sensor histidine kinase PhoR